MGAGASKNGGEAANFCEYFEMSINSYFGIGLMSKPPDIGMDS